MASDPLWDLPIEDVPAPGQPDPVSEGESLPTGYIEKASATIDMMLGKLRSDIDAFQHRIAQRVFTHSKRSPTVPEYLSPGVYVEEVSFRSKSIEGVATSTTGFAGMTRSGPVQYPGGPTTTEPRLITSFTEFERVYGSLDSLAVGSAGQDERLCFVAHAARAFFDNGGQRLYISRVFVPRGNRSRSV